MSNNSNLHRAKKAKNDEFYTMLSDIENELSHYLEHFNGKIVYCNCDDPTQSNFVKYFQINFDKLNLKKLIATGYRKDSRGVKLVYDGENKDANVEELEGNGDFRSEECVKLLDEADIVVSNPPFSIIDEYLDQLVKHRKKFLFIGPLMMMMRKSAFDLVKTEKMWPGLTWVKEFKTDDGEMQKFGNIVWYTNLDHTKRHEKIVCVEKYSPEKYPAYANYPNAVEVGKIANIPVDYDGEMGVTVSYLMKHNPDQFEIVGGARWLATKMTDMGWPKDSYVPGGVAFYLDESTPTKRRYRCLFGRVVIKRRRYRRLFGRVVIKRRKPVGENGKTPAV